MIVARLHAAADMGAVAIDGDDEEADEGEYERGVGGREIAEDRALVDDHCLQRGQYGTTEDGHDKARCPELCVVAQTIECNAIDGWEHE